MVSTRETSFKYDWIRKSWSNTKNLKVWARYSDSEALPKPKTACKVGGATPPLLNYEANINKWRRTILLSHPRKPLLSKTVTNRHATTLPNQSAHPSGMLLLQPEKVKISTSSNASIQAPFFHQQQRYLPSASTLARAPPRPPTVQHRIFLRQTWRDQHSDKTGSNLNDRGSRMI